MAGLVRTGAMLNAVKATAPKTAPVTKQIRNFGGHGHHDPYSVRPRPKHQWLNPNVKP